LLKAPRGALKTKQIPKFTARPGALARFALEGTTMFAVIKAGGKQYRVAAEDVIRIDRVEKQPGEVVAFGEVLLVGGETPTLGAPTVSGATVAGEVLAHERGDKVIAFKKRRRKNSRRKRGYRHEFSLIRITEILTEGRKPSDTPPPRPKREAKPKPEAATDAEGGEGETRKAAGKKTAAKGKKPATKGKKPAAKGTKK
jgi:large subunit ribosomal protein L21